MTQTKKDTGASSPNATYATGPGGLLNTPGMGEAPRKGRAKKAKVVNATLRTKATWSGAQANDLPDSAFLYVEPGGKKDGDGKTVPRSLRHFPYKNAQGGVDLPHLRNALARIPQANIPADKKASLTKRAQDLLKNANSKELDDSFVVFKQADGSYRWVIKSTNAYEDHDGEIVSQKSLADDCDYTDATEVYPVLRWWHLGDLRSGVDMGRGDFNALFGRFRVDSGTFNDAEIGQAVKEHAPQLAASVGFNHPKTEPDAEGVYHRVHVFEVSLLPRQNAANPFTAIDVLKENDMATYEEKAKELAALVGEQKAKELLTGLSEQQKQLDPLVKHKEEQPAPPAAPTLAPTDPLVALMTAVPAPVPAVTQKAAGTAAVPGQRGAMFSQMRKAGTYDEEKARGVQPAPPVKEPPAAQAAPAADQKPAMAAPTPPPATPAADAKDASADGLWPGDAGEGEPEPDGDEAGGEGEDEGVDISGMTVADLHAAIAAGLAEMILSSKELRDVVTKEIGAQLATVEATRTKEADTAKQRMLDLNKRVKALEGDADTQPGYRASREPTGVDERLKEAKPFIDPEMQKLAGLILSPVQGQ